MATKPMYPQSWVPVEFVCPCGVKCRVDVEHVTGPFSAQFFQHGCGKDDGRALPGPRVIATWEERSGKWERTDVSTVPDFATPQAVKTRDPRERAHKNRSLKGNRKKSDSKRD